MILSQVYPLAEWHHRRLFLSDEQLESVRAEAGTTFASPLVARYDLTADGKPAGRAYIDTHIVRSKKESLLICLGPDGKVRRVEVTAFFEPPEYQLSPRWLEQFDQLGDNDSVRLGNAIRPAAGATLSAMATTQAVRRILTLDRLLMARHEGRRDQ
jgi:hypothetical protein